jgi:hypothetical protein
MNKITKMFFILASCLALVSVAPGAEEQNKNKPQPKKKPVQAGQVSQPPRKTVGKPTTAGKPASGAARAMYKPAGPSKTTTYGKPQGAVKRTTTTSAQAGKVAGAAKVTRAGTFKPQRFNLPTKTAPTKIAAVNFRQGRHIEGSQNWQGSRYTVFRTYTPQWHDQVWWRSHYNRVVFVYGGWYYWNAGFWFPAWGYAPNAYYAYDGPIYAYNNLPPDQVVANVQTSLQQQGYYHGEVDGLLGPLTRAAVADYQRDHGLYITSAIDEPTLSSLGMT